MAEEKPIGSVVHGPTLFSGADIFLFKEGNHFQLYDKLGSRPMTVDGRTGAISPSGRRTPNGCP